MQYKRNTVEIIVTGQGAEANISNSESTATIWAPDEQQASALAIQLIDRAVEQNVSLNAACFMLNSHSAMYPNHFVDVES